MALFLDNTSEEPQTHILIIGVGEYPYLKNGKNSQTFQEQYLNELGQLSSPPASAAFFYQTVLQMAKGHFFTHPVGSIEVLTDNGVVPGEENEEPTKRNIQEAYYRWKDRCDKNEENVAIFYFAGHGFGITDHCLLPKDFGSNTRNPFEAAIAFDHTATAFRACKANTQIFFVDACRIIPPETRFQGINFIGLDYIQDVMLPEKPHTLIMKAASHNEGAYGRKNKESFFVSALLKGMNAYGAVNIDGKWVVETGNLVKDINNWLKLEKASEGYLQRCSSFINDSFSLLELPSAPTVTLSLNCKPPEALSLATLSYNNLKSKEVSNSRLPHAEPWSIAVPAGIYRIGAEFGKRQYHAEDLYESINPPFANHFIECQKIH